MYSRTPSLRESIQEKNLYHITSTEFKRVKKTWILMVKQLMYESASTKCYSSIVWKETLKL